MKIFNGSPNKVAIKSSDLSYTYSEVHKISDSFSELLSPELVYGLAGFNDIDTVLLY